jgi:hypothetical protein
MTQRWRSFRLVRVVQAGNAPPCMKLRKTLSSLPVTQDTSTLTHLTRICSADLPDTRTIDFLGTNSSTDHRSPGTDIVFSVALRRRWLLCDRAYQYPIQLNLPVETGFGYCLGYIFVIVSVHLLNRTSQLRQTYYRLGCVTVIVSGLFLTQSANRDWLRLLRWLSLWYCQWSLASKHPYAAFSAVWDRLRLPCWLCLYQGRWSPAFGRIPLKVVSRAGLRLPYRLSLC